MPCSVPDASSHGAVLEIITGDSPSALLASLDDVLTTAPLPPFDDDIVVVQSLGMERWVRQQLARRRGCAASLRIPFPAAFCRSLAEDLQPLQTIDARFDEEALTWRLFTLLENDALMQEVVFEPLRQFLSSSDPVKRYGLARRISARFDEYRLYRPHWLLDWEADEDEGAAGRTLRQISHMRPGNVPSGAGSLRATGHSRCTLRAGFCRRSSDWNRPRRPLQGCLRGSRCSASPPCHRSSSACCRP